MLIDISVQLDDRTPAYPGDPKIEIVRNGTFESDGCVGHSVTLGTHTGTHIDAPAHMIEGSKTLGDVSLECFIGKGKLVEGFSIEAIDTAGVEPGDIVLFYTTASLRYYGPSYFVDYPVMSDDVAAHLIKKEVKLVGLDTCSADNEPGFPVHKRLLGAGIPIIENLTNLIELRGKNFHVYALPLKLNLDGAPARVVAEAQDNG